MKTKKFASRKCIEIIFRRLINIESLLNRGKLSFNDLIRPAAVGKQRMIIFTKRWFAFIVQRKTAVAVTSQLNTIGTEHILRHSIVSKIEVYENFEGS